jgi:hypothetical protein
MAGSHSAKIISYCATLQQLTPAARHKKGLGGGVTALKPLPNVHNRTMQRALRPGSQLLAYRPLLHREWPMRWSGEAYLAVEPKADSLDGGDLRRWQACLHSSGTQIAS